MAWIFAGLYGGETFVPAGEPTVGVAGIVARGIGEFDGVIEHEFVAVGFVDDAGDFSADLGPDFDGDERVFDGDGMGHGGAPGVDGESITKV
jgi:hypothetical protein